MFEDEDLQNDLIPSIPHDDEEAEDEDEENPEKHGMHIEGEEEPTDTL